MPKIPKDPAKRRRTNKAVGATTLESSAASGTVDLGHVPVRWRELPEARPRPHVTYVREGRDLVEVDRTGAWHECTVEWWAEIVRSPMAREFVAVDWHGLFRLAVLVDDLWHSGDPKLEAEVRQAQAAFGLTPVDRRRLQWEAAKGEQAEARRRSSLPPATPASKRPDPRLRLVRDA